MRSLLMRAALAAAACLVSAVPSARADTVMTFSGWTNVEDNSTPYSLGENFTVDHAIQITALGYLDIGSQDHQVGIYDLSGNLLVSTTVDPSTDPLSDFFNYHTLATPITLAAGTYVLAGTDGPDGGDITYTGSAGSFVTDFQVAPGFSFFNDRFTASSTLAFPAPPSHIQSLRVVRWRLSIYQRRECARALEPGYRPERCPGDDRLCRASTSQDRRQIDGGKLAAWNPFPCSDGDDGAGLQTELTTSTSMGDMSGATSDDNA